MNKTLTIIVAVLGGIMILLLAVVFVVLLQNVLSSSDDAPPTLASTAQAELTSAPEGEDVPTVVVEVPSTFTPLPTSTSTETPIATTPAPTDTPAPTNTLPPATPTNTPAPVIIPTNPPPPPPPPTDAPPPAPPPQDTRGLVATHFGLQPRSDYRVNQQLWFDFSIVNNTGGEVPYYRLGVMPRKDGADRIEWFQQSYGGPNATIKPQGLNHEDNIKLPESGTYTLRLAICFDSWEACNSGGGTWVTMSNEISITIS
jgi:hypothetical protein